MWLQYWPALNFHSQEWYATLGTPSCAFVSLHKREWDAHPSPLLQVHGHRISSLHVQAANVVTAKQAPVAAEGAAAAAATTTAATCSPDLVCTCILCICFVIHARTLSSRLAFMPTKVRSHVRLQPLFEAKDNPPLLHTHQHVSTLKTLQYQLHQMVGAVHVHPWLPPPSAHQHVCYCTKPAVLVIVRVANW